MVTDSLRALLLEAQGYETQVFEFVSLEHTSKNKMILAVRRGCAGAGATKLLRQIGDIKAFYGIREHCLETLLGEAPAQRGSDDRQARPERCSRAAWRRTPPSWRSRPARSPRWRRVECRRASRVAGPVATRLRPNAVVPAGRPKA